MTSYSRRDAVRLGGSVGAALAAWPRQRFPSGAGERPYLDAALQQHPDRRIVFPDALTG